ncbi:O-antigen ligase family protein [Vibrio splendidus]|uniref:O-antigen ligase family protein n=1 Tax=Vibrio splendidus TaxID=29497 RepID=UPI001FB231E3|nr:O-antigen ligase family protein [Vibrio splendidus]UOE80942.1 O-antigen ligase family protein [Vibrio splendidus]
MKNILNKESVILFIILLPVYFSFSGLFLYENSPKNLQALIAISLLLSIYQFGINHVKQQFVKNKILWCITLFISYGLYQKHLHGFSSGLIKTYGFLLLYFIVIPEYLFSKVKSHLLNLSLVASICSLAYFYQQDVLLDRNRMSWGIGVLHYTVMSSWLACFALYKLTTTKDKFIILKSVLVISISAFLIIETQARSAFASLSFLAVGYFLFTVIKNKKHMAFFSIAILLLISILTQVPAIKDRVSETENEISMIKDGKLQSSLGLRVQMWEAATYMVAEKPIIGVGKEHYAIKSELAENHIIDPIVVKFSHYHNGYVDILVKSGIVGLSFIIFLLSYPLYIWTKNRNKECFPCLSLGLLYMISSLTNVPLNNLHLVFFFMMISWIYSCNQLNTTELNHRNPQ